MFRQAAKVVTMKVINASWGWGLGTALMVFYGLLIFFLQTYFDYKYMLIGAMVFMIVTFYFTDLWWHYQGLKRCARLKNVSCSLENKTSEIFNP